MALYAKLKLDETQYDEALVILTGMALQGLLASGTAGPIAAASAPQLAHESLSRLADRIEY